MSTTYSDSAHCIANIGAFPLQNILNCSEIEFVGFVQYFIAYGIIVFMKGRRKKYLFNRIMHTIHNICIHD